MEERREQLEPGWLQKTLLDKGNNKVNINDDPETKMKACKVRSENLKMNWKNRKKEKGRKDAVSFNAQKQTRERENDETVKTKDK